MSSCDGSFGVLSYEELHAYGSTGWWAEVGALEASKRDRFTGLERDEETGLQVHSQRYDSPRLGRWGRPDPIGMADGGNLWAYVKGRVTTGRDGRGLGSTDQEIEHRQEGSRKAASAPRQTPPGIPLVDSAEAAALGWVAGFVDVAGVGSLEMLAFSYSVGELHPICGHLNHFLRNQLAASGAVDSLRSFSSETYNEAKALDPDRAAIGYGKGFVAGIVVPSPGMSGDVVGAAKVVGATSRSATAGKGIAAAARAVPKSSAVSPNYANFGMETLDDAIRLPSNEVYRPAAANRLQAEAAIARDALVDQLAGKRYRPATVVGAYSPGTGRIATGSSRGAGRGCAEYACAEALGFPGDIHFTTAVRPRSREPVPVCATCEEAFGRNAFPDPTTQYATDLK